MSRMKVRRFPSLEVVQPANIYIDSLAGQIQAMKTGVAPPPAKKKIVRKKAPAVEEDDDESDTDGEVDDDTSETNTDTESEGE